MGNEKISIRFFNDREVRAVWDEETAKWWFNVIDIVAILNEQDDYTKANNYWRWLKRKLKSKNNQLVSATHGFKFVAADEKKRLKKCVDWSKISKRDYMNAMMLSPTKINVLNTLLKNALTTKINDREMFLKGIDYSYYYEEND